eukprot:2917156-Alexandrium_andersonii.AAC.1
MDCQGVMASALQTACPSKFSANSMEVQAACWALALTCLGRTAARGRMSALLVAAAKATMMTNRTSWRSCWRGSWTRCSSRT